MTLKIFLLANLTLLSLNACVSEQPLALDAARTLISRAWQADQHIVWEIEWPAVPINGPLVVETWRTGDRFRFEILESAVPALVGQVLIFDGQSAWHYNRFDPAGALRPAAPVLSPVSDAFDMVARLLARSPASATRQATVQLSHGPAQKISLAFPNKDSLTFWLDQQTGLPARVLFSVGGQQAILQARSLEPLPDPAAGLFEPAEWETQPSETILPLEVGD